MEHAGMTNEIIKSYLRRIRARSPQGCIRRSYLHSRHRLHRLHRLLAGACRERRPRSGRPGAAGAGAAVSCRCGPSQAAWRQGKNGAARHGLQQCKAFVLLSSNALAETDDGLQFSFVLYSSRQRPHNHGGLTPPPLSLFLFPDVSSVKTTYTLASVVEDGGNFYQDRPTPTRIPQPSLARPRLFPGPHCLPLLEEYSPANG